MANVEYLSGKEEIPGLRCLEQEAIFGKLECSANSGKGPIISIVAQKILKAVIDSAQRTFDQRSRMLGLALKKQPIGVVGHDRTFCNKNFKGT